MNILFDTNVIVDIWSASDDFEYSYRAFDTALLLGFKTCIAVTSAPSIMYLLPARKMLSRREAHEAFGELMDIVTILDATEADCRRAHEGGGGDFEDDLIAHAAHRHGVDLIVTRNKRDFARSPVPALTPKEFVDLYKSSAVDYEMIPWPEE